MGYFSEIAIKRMAAQLCCGRVIYKYFARPTNCH